jgi:hypothetical protein
LKEMGTPSGANPAPVCARIRSLGIVHQKSFLLEKGAKFSGRSFGNSWPKKE